MSAHSKFGVALFSVVFLLAIGVICQPVVAEDVVHAVSGVVKHVDKATKTVVIKTADGTEEARCISSGFSTGEAAANVAGPLGRP